MFYLLIRRILNYDAFVNYGSGGGNDPRTRPFILFMTLHIGNRGQKRLLNIKKWRNKKLEAEDEVAPEVEEAVPEVEEVDQEAEEEVDQEAEEEEDQAEMIWDILN